MAEELLAVIPARGGSRGIPGKNVRPFLGRPLLEWTVESALRSDVFARVVLSTDDPAIAEVGRGSGAEVPFLRPAELARSDSATVSAVRHALQWLSEREGWEPRWVFVLEPTSPTRRPFHLREAAALLRESGADSLASVSPVPHHYLPQKVLRMGEDGSIVGQDGTPLSAMVHRRQELPSYYALDGLIYACRAALATGPAATLWGERVIGYRVDPKYGVDLDEPEDWANGELRMRQILDEERDPA